MNKIIISDIAIHQDAEGRYSLNDLHKASGAEARHYPAQWLRLDQTNELIQEILNVQICTIKNEAQVAPTKSKTGRYGGTYVCKELVYAYAMWISAAFALKVIRAYDAMVTGQAKQAKQKALPNGLSIEQQCSLKELVKARAEVLPKEKQGRALITCWSALKSKFGVSYKEIHPDNFIEALSLVSRLPLEGELMEREALPAPAAKPQFTDEQLQILAWLWRASEYMLRTINDAYPTVMKAEYERASTFYSIQREYPRIIYQAQALLAAATAHVQYDQRVDNNWSRVLPVLRHVAIPRM